MRRLRRIVAVIAASAVALSTQAALGQADLDDARSARDEVRRERAAAAAELDLARARDAEVAQALEALTAQVNAQQALVDDAARRVAAADAARLDAEARLAEAEAARAELRDRLVDRAIAGFVGEARTGDDLLSTGRPLEAMRRSALLAQVQAGTGDVLEALRGLEEDRVLAQAEAEAALAAADQAQAELARGLVELEQQRQAQAELKAELERRVERWEAQVAAFAAEEEELTAFIQAELAAIEQRRLAAEAEARQRAAEEAARQEAARQEAARQEAARRDQRATAPAQAPPNGRPAPAPTAAPSPAPSTGGWQWPLAGRVASGFGYRIHPIFGTSRLHAGIDIAAPTGTPFHAARPGTVIFSGWRNGFGNTVMLVHDDGLVSLYAHNSRNAVSAGAVVAGGQVIGYVGSTGWSTGPHLHFEIRVNGRPVDPRPYLP
jgi:murein DD-endopeptidase MepM/ murein hydrolase activator NlpD